LCLCLIKHDSTKAYGEVEERLHVFFASEEEEVNDEVQAPAALLKGTELPVTTK